MAEGRRGQAPGEIAAGRVAAAMIVADLVAQIREGNVIEGLEAGIKQCGDLLLEKGFKKTNDDTNELSDDLRVN